MHSYRFSLLVMLAFSAALVARIAVAADAPPAAPPSAEEQAAIAAIEKLGGSVRAVSKDTDLKDVDFHLTGTALTDDGLDSVKKLKNVVSLDLKGTKVTDAGLAYLKDMKTLKRLHLELTGITDAGLANLTGLDNLEYLNVYGTKVSDAGLKQLAALKGLKKLYVWQSTVTDKGIDELKKARPDMTVTGAAELKPVVALTPATAPPKPKPAKKKPTKTLAQGQFVRVRLTGPGKILSLAEVEVVQAGDGADLRKGAVATQSSVEFGGAPERAIDGNPSGIYDQNSVTHTKAENDPWWMVDFKGLKDVGRIIVYNRTEVGERLEGATVEVLDPAKKVVYTTTIKGATDDSSHTFEVNK